eukprot:PhM_4_TR11447/c0_g1_i1/m.72944
MPPKPSSPRRRKKKKADEGMLSHPEFPAPNRAEMQIRFSVLESKHKRLQDEHSKLTQECEQLRQHCKDAEESEKTCFQIAERDRRDRQHALDQQKDLYSEVSAELEKTISDHKDAVDSLVKAHADEISTLEMRLLDVQTKYDGLTEFIEERDKMYAKMKDLEETIERMISDHAEVLEGVRMDAESDRKTTRDAMIRKLRQTRDELFQLTDDHRDLKTHQTMKENERLSRDVAMYEREVRALMQQVTELTDECQENAHALAVERDTSGQLVKRTHQQDRVIAALTAKVEELTGDEDERRRGADADRIKKIAALSETVDRQYEIIVELKRELDSLVHKNADVTAQLSQLRRERARERDEGVELQQFLVGCLSDVKKVAARTNTQQSSVVDLDVLDVADKLEVLNYLIRKMNVWNSGLAPTAPPPPTRLLPMISPKMPPAAASSAASSSASGCVRQHHRQQQNKQQYNPHPPAPPPKSSSSSTNPTTPTIPHTPPGDP